MEISAIVATDLNGCIGKGNQIPWHLPADLKYFRMLTTGHTVIMGRKTFESIGKPLPNRVNIVISRKSDYEAEGCTVVQDIEMALELSKSNKSEKVFIIGGGEIYRQSQNLWQSLFLTLVETEIQDGEVFFPAIHESEWELLESRTFEPDEKNTYLYHFKHYRRA